MKKLGWGAFFVAVFVGPIALMFIDGNPFATGEVKGSLGGDGPSVGEFTLSADKCRSGEPDGFFGVYLGTAERSDSRVKVFQDQVYGRMVQVQVPGSCDGPRCKQMMLGSESCERFVVRLEKTNTTVNDVVVLEGELGLDCTLASGDKVRGDLRFEGCH